MLTLVFPKPKREEPKSKILVAHGLADNIGLAN